MRSIVLKKGEDMVRTRRRVLSSVALALLVAVAVFAVAAQAAGNPKATGGGTTEELGEKSTFSFNAVEKPDGSVSGHMLYNFRGGDVIIHMDIDCLNITGNSAKLSGVVTKVGGNPPAFIFVGQGAFSRSRSRTTAGKPSSPGPDQ